MINCFSSKESAGKKCCLHFISDSLAILKLGKRAPWLDLGKRGTIVAPLLRFFTLQKRVEHELMTIDMTYIYIGGGFAALIATLLSVAFSNHSSASRLESATHGLVTEKQQSVIKPALRQAILSVSADSQDFTKEQWNAISLPIDTYTTLDRLNQKVMTIRDHTTESIYSGALCAIATFAAGVFYALDNSLWGLAASIAGILFLVYVNSGILQARKIRGLERINRRILTSETVEELKKIADEALSKYFS